MKANQLFHVFNPLQQKPNFNIAFVFRLLRPLFPLFSAESRYLGLYTFYFVSIHTHIHMQAHRSPHTSASNSRDED